MTEATLEKPNTAVNGAVEGVHKKSVFISAPSNLDTRVVRAALEGKGVRCFSADQIDLPGQNLPQILREAVSQADLVIGVVDDTSASNAVFFEVGFAQAMDKPTVVLLLADAPTTTWLSSGIPYFRYRPEVPSTLDFGLSQFLKALHHGTKRPSASSRRTHAIGDRVDQLLAQLRDADQKLDALEFEHIIAEAIRASGVSSVSLKGTEDKGIDIAVWSDDLSPWVGNPLPIEVRLVLRTTDLNATVVPLTQAMARGGMPWGLLIYHRAEGDLRAAMALPNIILLSAEQFLEHLRKVSFGEVVRGLRNLKVHGGC